MIRKDGHVFINDPMGVEPGAPWRDDLKNIENIIDYAKSNVRGRP
jgi:hypothetical protein